MAEGTNPIMASKGGGCQLADHAPHYDIFTVRCIIILFFLQYTVNFTDGKAHRI